MGIQKGKGQMTEGKSKGGNGGPTQEHEGNDSARGGPASMTGRQEGV